MTLKVKRNISWIFIALFSIVAVLVQIVKMEDEMMNLIKGIFGLFCFAIATFVVGKNVKGEAILIGLMATFLMFFSYVYNENIRPNNFAWIWSYLGVAMLLYEYGGSRKLSLYIFYGFSLYFLYLSVFGGIDSRDALGQNSANYVSVLLIFCICIYYVALRQFPIKDFSYIPLLVLLFLSAWAGNRSGIVCMGIVIPIVVLLNRKISAKSHHQFRFVFLLVISTIGILVLSNYIADYTTSLTSKRESVGMASQRSLIWSEYINGAFENFGNFIFGVPTKNPKYLYLSHFVGNPHNTFLMLHAKYGIIGFLLVIVYIIKAIRKSIRMKDYLVLVITIAIVTRSFFDWCAFPGLYDVFYYYIIFYVLDNNGVNLIRNESNVVSVQ